MSRHYAYVTLGILAGIFILGLGESMGHPFDNLIPESFIKVAATVLAGVAIGTILAGLKSNGGGDIFVTGSRDSDDHTDSQHHDV